MRFTLHVFHEFLFIEFKSNIQETEILPGVPDFGRLVNPYLNQGDRLCPPNYFWYPQIFRPSDSPEPTFNAFALQGELNFHNDYLSLLYFWYQVCKTGSLGPWSIVQCILARSQSVITDQYIVYLIYKINILCNITIKSLINYYKFRKSTQCWYFGQ